MKNTPSILILLLLLTGFHTKSTAQKTPAANALALTDSLVFNTSLTISYPSVTYNPVAQKYYSARMGYAGYPLHTWNKAGGLSIFQDTVGMDTRGIWWNPNTNQVERNCFNSLGWSTINLDGSNNATRNFNVLFTGQNQPTIQSTGAYDFNTNTVLFYNAGNLSVYNRNTAALTATIPLTGTSLTNVNTVTVIYTGQTGFEIGLLDFSAKRILLFNRTTGVFSGQSQLPSTAVTSSQFRFSYANDRVWLFNSPTRTWNSFYIWSQPLPLPINLLSFSASPESDKVRCNWTTSAETNNDFFSVEKSRSGNFFEVAGMINGSGNSTEILDYSFTDEHPYSGISYYRLKQTDFDGRHTYSAVVSVNKKDGGEKFIVYPNPASDVINVQNSTDESVGFTVELYDMAGSRVSVQSTTSGDNSFSADISNFKKGVYMLRVVSDDHSEQKQIIIQ